MDTARPPETVREYLDQLRRALKGAPAGLIADALADCEEHLNNEIAQNPDKDEKTVLAEVVETYGSPAEIAEEYRAREATISTPFPKPDSAPPPQGGFFGVIADPRTYGALLYMLLAIASGLLYFTWAIIGISITIGCAILIIGIPFALLFIGSVRLLAHVEGRIVEGLLGVRMPRRLPPVAAPDETLWTRIKEAIGDLRTWTSMFYLLLMLPLGAVYFTLVVTGLSLSLALSGTAVYSLLTNQSHIEVQGLPWLDHLLGTAPGLVLMLVLGGLMFFVVLHLARLIGWLHGKIAESLLVRL